MKNICIFGHNGMVGSAIYKELNDDQNLEILTVQKEDLDLRCQGDVNHFFKNNKIDEVYLAAAKVGGIYANNTFPADFIYDNTLIEFNVIKACLDNNVKKLLFLGSSCIYPKNCEQPIKESYLLSGSLEETNEAYALAKIVGLKFCQNINKQHEKKGFDYRCVMPCNLYGQGDNYDGQNSHVIPALMKKFHQAKINGHSIVNIWGSGNQLREFLNSADLAKGIIHVMNVEKSVFSDITKDSAGVINIGSGEEITIKNLALMIKDVVNFKGKIEFDSSMPDGTPRKILDNTKINALGWRKNIDFEKGLYLAYEDYIDRHG